MTAADLARVDVPLAALDADLKALAERKRIADACAVLRESQARHAALGNEQEVVADGDAIYLLTHPELCSTDADYPGWTPPHLEATA